MEQFFCAKMPQSSRLHNHHTQFPVLGSSQEDTITFYLKIGICETSRKYLDDVILLLLI